MKNCRIFALAIEKQREFFNKARWSGSSVWLEYMPVTHGVASSSLVRTAKLKKSSRALGTFFVTQTPRKSLADCHANSTSGTRLGADWF